MFEALAANIQKYIKLSEDEQKDLSEFFEEKSFKTKTVLLREGEICQFEAYIKKGCVRIFYNGESGQEVTLAFAIEDWWVCDIASFSEQKPSRLFMETLEETEVVMLNPKTKEQLLAKNPRLERFFRLLVQRNLCAIQNRLLNTISKSAAERYVEFIQLYPTIPQRVPQYYIASYLGVSPEFVSKIRKKLASQ
ncbi:Crp/Fnr family transcriptional regulator [Soonwooa sp.]|uniref:Crp/Fnr family transcriptional regulator n=1 Tax=Soonwooa sp. TaxID=1938592 RepID=UPI002601E230|nr:Crp/Fnr family transcriptional regulator [Soonwooa sp.]